VHKPSDVRTFVKRRSVPLDTFPKDGPAERGGSKTVKTKSTETALGKRAREKKETDGGQQEQKAGCPAKKQRRTASPGTKGTPGKEGKRAPNARQSLPEEKNQKATRGFLKSIAKKRPLSRIRNCRTAKRNRVQKEKENHGGDGTLKQDDLQEGDQGRNHGASDASGGSRAR